MSKKYNEDYAGEIVATFLERLKPEFKKAVYSIEIDPDFNEPPVLETLRVVSNLSILSEQPELAHKIAKMCIVGRQVKICKDGELLPEGIIQLNSVNDSFDAYAVFRRDPIALEKLIEMALGYILEKCLPSPKKGTVGKTA